METMQKKEGFIALSTEDPRQVVYKIDNHIGFTSAKEAVFAIHKHETLKDEIYSFRELEEYLLKWLKCNKMDFDKAILTIRDNRYLLLVINNSIDFNEVFEDKLSDLDIEIASKFESIKCDIQSLPKCLEDNYAAFCDPNWMLVYSGDAINAAS